MSDQQAPAAGNDVVNYDDIWDYEPRQTTFGNVPLWGRGIPRAPLVYAIVLTIALVLLGTVPVIGAPLHLLSGPRRLVACAALAGGLSWWSWELPPGGVRPHRAASSMLRGLLYPWHLRGWIAVAGDVEDLRLDPLPLEPDFAGRWARTRYTGPGMVIRVAPAREQRLTAAGRGPVRVYRQDPDGELTGPQMLQIPAGRSVELGPADLPESR